MGKIIDISEHNGSIDFSKVKQDGISGVIIRAGYGRNNEDECFRTYMNGATNAGIPVGIYWFSYAYTVEMARNEAQYALESVKDYKLGLPVFFDWEYDSMRYAQKCGVNPSRNLITEMNKEFCRIVKDAGYKAGWYANPDYLNNYIDESELTDYYKWFAWYTSDREGEKCALWQYSSDGDVSGISGGVDMNTVIDEDIFVREKDKVHIDFDMLSKGSKGADVRALQRLLISWGYNLYIDGDFGSKTERYVKELQKKLGLVQDGIVGSNSWNKFLFK